MKALSIALLLMATLAFVMLGCSDSSAPVAGPTDETISSPSSPMVLAKAGVRHSLTGSANTYNILKVNPFLGNVILPGPKQKGGFYNVVTVNAIEHSDGTFSGNMVSQFQGKIPSDYVYQYVEFLGTVKMKVIQLTVDETGTKAKVVCEITSWDGPPLPWWFVMAFVDKGQGQSAASRDEVSSWWFSDQISDRDLWLSQTPQQYIDWQWAQIEPYISDLGATYPIDHGNIQVR